MKNLKLTILLTTLWFFAFSQNKVPELITDRPDQTESSSVVPKNSLQIETGFLLENDAYMNMEISNYAYNTTLLRYGLSNNFELRLGAEFLGIKEHFTNIDSTYNTSGLSPLYTGFKIQIREEDGIIPEIAFLGGISLPITAHEDFETTFLAPSMRFAFSHTLNDRFSIGYNLGTEWDGETAMPSYYYSVALGIGITETIGAYVESFGLIPDTGSESHMVDAGFTWLATPVFQFDVSGGLGLNDEATDNYFSVGITYRL